MDRYLLHGTPSKPEIIKELLRHRAAAPAAAAFYQGIEMLGPRTPDLTLIALRLVLAGKPADDARVTRLRDIVKNARDGVEREQAVDEYYKELA